MDPIKNRRDGMLKALRFAYAYGCGPKKLGEILAAKAEITPEEADGILARWMKAKGVTATGRTIGPRYQTKDERYNVNRQLNTIAQFNFEELEARIIADAIARSNDE